MNMNKGESRIILKGDDRHEDIVVYVDEGGDLVVSSYDAYDRFYLSDLQVGELIKFLAGRKVE